MHSAQRADVVAAETGVLMAKNVVLKLSVRRNVPPAFTNPCGVRPDMPSACVALGRLSDAGQMSSARQSPLRGRLAVQRDDEGAGIVAVFGDVVLEQIVEK